ncbi:MAG: hypothetical protein IIB00_00490 [candidate division Zixibacteria bacterium]|nr:hypothetical protein [candidate division Zixibacteria bacterium]
MIIKSFLADSIADALKMIRSDLGGKAVVLKTRALSAHESGQGRRMVEITACLDNPTVGAVGSLDRERVSGMSNASQKVPGAVEKRSMAPRIKDDTRMIPGKVAGGDDVRTLTKSQKLVLKRGPEVVENLADRPIDKPFEKPVVDHIEEMADETEEKTIQTAQMEKISSATETKEFILRLEDKLDKILCAQGAPKLVADFSDEAAIIQNILVKADIPDFSTRRLMIRLLERSRLQPDTPMRELAERMMVEEFAEGSLPGLDLSPNSTVLFIGPVGSGKTSSLGKMCVDLLFHKKQKVTIATLDDFKVAATEEIAGYAEALGANITYLENINDDADNYKRAERDDILLVDTHSNITDQSQYNKLLENSQSLKPDVTLLTISALTRSIDVLRLIRRLEPFRPTHLLLTHADLTATFGGLYAAMQVTGLKLMGVTNSPGAVGGINTPDPAEMARRIFHGAVINEN